MMDDSETPRDRRAILRNGLTLAGVLAIPSVAFAAGLHRQRLTAQALKPSPAPLPPSPTSPALMVEPTITSPRVIRPALLQRAMAALDHHGSRVTRRDRIAIADFTAPSSQPRFHFINLENGRSTSLLVAHGSGSDPTHTGFLQRFSNDFGSNASSEGAFLADDYYVGKHGRSQRLIGLDSTNDNALPRAIVLHSAWYANADMIRTHGQLGRSQGCFAVGEAELDHAFAQLGASRMIYSAKV